jgi:hypothetical protein
MLKAEVRNPFGITSAFSIQHSAFLSGFLALAVAWTWPLAARLSWRIPHDPGDPVLNTWILWWNAQAIPFTSAWWSPPIFYPMPGALALSEHLFGIAVFTTPLQLVGLSAIAAYNLALIASCWLSGYFAFCLARRLTGSTFGGVVAGLAFALAPYRASQLSHLQVLTTQWMPLALLSMHAWLDEGRRRWLVLFAVAWLLQALSNGYYMLFFPILIALWLLWFVDWVREWRRGAALVLAFAASSLLLVPSVLHYKHVHDLLGLHRSIDEMRLFSARLASFVQPAYLLKFWPPANAATQEGFLFPGVTVAVLAVAGVIALAVRGAIPSAFKHRSPAVFYTAAAVLLWWLCLGPARHPSFEAAIWRPYTLLTFLPGFEGLRVPARFALLAVLCISVAASIAAVRLAPRTRAVGIILGALVCGGLIVDGWIDALPLTAPPARAFLTSPENSLVVELPASVDKVATAAMYRSMLHGRPLVNGYSGHTPPHYGVFQWFTDLGDPGVLRHFARGRPLVVVVNRTEDQAGDVRRMVEDAGGVLQAESGVGPVFHIPPLPSLRAPALGPALKGIVDERSGGVDLGSEQLVRGITIPVRLRFGELDMVVSIETSIDGETWTSAWRDAIGEAALIAALEDARTNPMTLYLPDVRARYVRVTPSPSWVAEEMTVYGAK